MDLFKVRDKYRKKIKFFESKDVLNEKHIQVIIKGLYGMKTFIIDNNQMFEPVAIEWLDVYCDCRHKFDEDLFQKSVFFTTPTIIKFLIMETTSTSFVNDLAYRFFKILRGIPGHILGKTFKNRLPLFKMLGTKIFGCGIYSHQVTLLEILFRFFSEYRNYEFENNQNNTPILVLDELFPDIIKKNELNEIFLNIQKSSFDFDSRHFLNILNRCKEPCKVFSIVAESIIINEIKLKAPMLSNKSYQFWIDFNIDILQMSFPCKGSEECENNWLTNSIAKEDIDQIIANRNATHLNLFIYLKNISNLSSPMFKFDSNVIAINFTFILNEETMYLIKNVVPYYQSFLTSNSRMLNEVTPTKERTIKPKYYQKIITPGMIRLKYDTIVEEKEDEDHTLNSNIINYANKSLNSFTFEQSFSKNSPINFQIFNDLTSNYTCSTKQIEANKSTNKPLILSDITNQKTINTAPANVISLNGKQEKITVESLPKNYKRRASKKSINKSNSKIAQQKINEKAAIPSKTRKFTKTIKEKENKDSLRLKQKTNQRKPRKAKQLINRVVSVQSDTPNRKGNVNTNIPNTNSDAVEIQGNIQLVNSGIPYNGEIFGITAKNEKTTINNILPLNDGILPVQNNKSSVYDIENIRSIETKDNEFVFNIISQVRSQQTTKSHVAQPIMTNDELVPLHISTPVGKPVNNKHVTYSYRRFSKNNTSKLGYKCCLDFIEPSTKGSVKKQPLRVQAFRQSKSKIHSFCEIDTSLDDDPCSLDETSAQIENTVVVSVHVSNHTDTPAIQDTLSIKTQKNITNLNEVSTNKQIENQSDKLNHVISVPNSLGLETNVDSNDIPNNASIKQSIKPNIAQMSCVSMPMPIGLDEIKTEYVISVSDDTGYENTNPNSISLLNSKQSSQDLPVTQRETQSIELGSQRQSEIDDRPKQNVHNKRRAVDHAYNDIVSYNNIINQIQNTLLERSSVEMNRDTMSVDTTNDLSCGLQNQLELLNEEFKEMLENELNTNEILKELQNCKKARLDKQESFKLFVETKTQKLSKKQKKLISDLEMIQQLENELKESYVNLFKNLEKVKRRVNRNRDAICQENNNILQIKKREYELTKRLIKDIIDRSKNIRDSIWRQYIIDFGHNFQQELYERYLD